MKPIPTEILNRKGARNLALIPKEVLIFLNQGLVPTVNLVEWLAIDQLGLLQIVLKEIGESDKLNLFKEVITAEKKPTANTSIRVIGQKMAELKFSKTAIKSFKSHPSDTVRCWACWAESASAKTTASLLKAMKPYAGDGHFGVHEVAIFASKEKIAADLPKSIEILAQWATDKDENVRRYAAETIRPIGVWTKKIAALQEDPSIALPVLDALKSDSSKYVQNAVANWLNDASKSQPEWVQQTCHSWSKDSNSKETAYIVKRGLRTLNKK